MRLLSLIALDIDTLKPLMILSVSPQAMMYCGWCHKPFVKRAVLMIVLAAGLVMSL